MIEVDVNGTIVEFPDGTPKEVMQGALQKKFGSAAPESKAKPESVGTAEDVVKSAGSGLVSGAIGLAGAAGDAAEFGARGLDAATRFVGDKLGVKIDPRAPRDPTYGSADIKSGVEKVTGPLYKPQTTAGQYAHTVGEFVPGAAMGPGGVVARTAGVIVPAVASETAGQVTKGTPYEGAARFVGALTGGVASGLATRPSTAARAVRDALPEGVTPQVVDQAEQIMTRAQAQGITLSWPEALSQAAQRPVLTETLRHLEAAPQTQSRMAEFFAPRPQQVDDAVRGSLDAVAPPNLRPSNIGPAIAREAEGHVNDVRGRINAASEPHYQRASTEIMDPATMRQIRSTPGWEEASNAVRSDPQLNRYVAHLPDESIGFLNEVKKHLDTAAENAAAPVNQQRNMQRSAGYGADATVVRDAARNASQDYDIALAIQQAGREHILQPILDGPIGKLAKRDLPTRKAIDALFPESPLPNSQQEIAQAVGTLAQRSPRVASDLVRAHVEDVFNRASKDLQTGPNQAGGAKFRAQLVGNPQQEANLQAAIEALPHGQERWRGINNLLETLEATGTRQNPGSKTAYNQEFLKNAGQGGLAGDAVKTGLNPLKGGQKLIDRYERWKLGDNLDGLADIFTNPGSANLLRAIARMQPGSPQAAQIALRLVTQTAASR